ncbi:hypothetical protein [Octadecabacter sp. R77987]|uniref:hypothetical protein n=1 Tax=Octadecabacter sp. R77987 TaxID=3093874 RepID=UPI00366E1D0D
MFSRVQKTYLLTLGVVMLLSAIFLIPGAGLIFIIVTIGLGLIILIPLPYVLFALLAALPAVVLWRFAILRLPMLALGAAALVLYLGLPIRHADEAFAADLAAQGDFLPASAAFDTPVGVEIRRREDTAHLGPAGPMAAYYQRQVCGELCERLLTGGDVAWVRVVLKNDEYQGDRIAVHALFVAATPTECQAVTADFAPGQDCVLIAPDHGRAADLTVDITDDLRQYRGDAGAIYQPSGSRRITGYLGGDTSAPRAFQQTQLFHQRPTPLHSFDYVSQDRSSDESGIMIMRNRTGSAPVDPVALVATIGLRFGPVRAFPIRVVTRDTNPFASRPAGAQDAAYAATLVAAGPEGQDQFSRSFAMILNNWHDKLRQQDSISSSERAIFCDTLASEALARPFWADQVIRKHDVTCPSTAAPAPRAL